MRLFGQEDSSWAKNASDVVEEGGQREEGGGRAAEAAVDPVEKDIYQASPAMEERYGDTNEQGEEVVGTAVKGAGSARLHESAEAGQEDAH